MSIGLVVEVEGEYTNDETHSWVCKNCWHGIRATDSFGQALDKVIWEVPSPPYIQCNGDPGPQTTDPFVPAPLPSPPPICFPAWRDMTTALGFGGPDPDEWSAGLRMWAGRPSPWLSIRYMRTLAPGHRQTPWTWTHTDNDTYTDLHGHVDTSEPKGLVLRDWGRWVNVAVLLDPCTER